MNFKSSPNMKFRMVRMAIVSFGKEGAKIERTQMRTGDLVVELSQEVFNDEFRLVSAIVPVSQLEFDSERFVIVPDDVRREAEQGLEKFVNMISVAYGLGRTISSPEPCLGFIPEDQASKDFLSQGEGIRSAPVTRGKIDILIDIKTVGGLLDDRSDGLSLMSEAMSCSHLTGKFHEFTRVFERAFRLSGAGLIDPMFDFISKDFEFTKDEVKAIVYDYRNPATHAGSNKKFLIEAEIAPIMDRAEQAAYDVLFNKLEWRNPSVTRRRLWTPRSRLGKGGLPTIVRGDALSMVQQVFDGFGSYPLFLGRSLYPILPQDLWVGTPRTQVKATGKYNVINDELSPRDPVKP